MDPIELASAIDDSFEPAQFGPISADALSRHGEPLTQEAFRFNGPRSGHWTVRDTLLGSAIDGGAPTAYGAAIPDSSAVSGARPIDSVALRNLVKATEASKETKRLARAQDQSASSHYSLPQAAPRPLENKKAPKGFYVPRTDDLRGIRIVSKTGTKEVVRAPEVVMDMPVTKKQQPKPTDPKPHATSPQPFDEPKKAPSIVKPATPRRQTRIVRVTGKNGEQAMLELPIINITRAPSIAESRAPPKAPANARNEKAENLSQDVKAAEAARQLREERMQRDREEQFQCELKKTAAAQPMTHGVTRPPSLPPDMAKPASGVPSKSSSKSTRGAFGGISDGPSKRPSAASSKTSKPPSSRHDWKPTSSKVPSEQFKVASGGTMMQSSSQTKTKVPSAGSPRNAQMDPSRPASVHSTLQVPHKLPGEQTYQPPQTGWEEVGTGWNYKAGSAPSPASKPHISGIQHTPRSSKQSEGRGRVLSNPRSTVFAGRGWISPHPLSVVSSDANSPEREIHLPSRGGREARMSHKEFKAMQQEGRRQGSNSYRAPVVQSVSTDGKIQIHIPWGEGW